MENQNHHAGVFDPVERAREKQSVRERDDARLRSGEVSRLGLRREVGLFSALDLSRSKIVRRRGRISA